MGVLFALIVGLFVGFSQLNTEHVFANEDGDDYSLYHRASEIAKAFDADEGPTSEGGSVWLDSEPIAGNAGGLLGYTNESTNWLTSTFSANSTSYSYSQLVDLGGGTSLPDNPLLAYAMYGSELVRLGLLSSEDSGIGNTLLGWLFSIGYWFAQIVPAVFKLMLNMLTILNPFQLFFGAIEGMDAVNIPMVNDLAGIISSIYTTIQSLAVTIAVPILIALTVVSIFMFKGSAGKKVLRVVVKVFMIFAGIPLIGATYTSIIDGMADGMEMGTPFADYIVMTQFVDSEGWIKSSRLAPPTENPITLQESNRTSRGYINHDPVTREMVLEINATLVADNDWMLTLFTGDSAVFGDGSHSYDDAFNSTSGQDMLDRFRTGQRFSAADYEGYAKAQLNNMDPPELVASMFEPNSNDLLDLPELFTSGETFEGIGRSIYNMGGLHVPEDDLFMYTFSGVDSGTLSDNLPASTKGAGLDNLVGLSPLAMYNFLNTSFGESTMTVYSPETSASAWSSNDYASVTKVDSGFTGVIYALESLVILVASSVIGLAYAFGLFKIVMASLPRILAGVFGTAMGSMAMITKLLVSTVVLLIELIGTMLLYTIFDTLLLGVLRGADNLILGLSGIPALLANAFVLKSIIIIVMSVSITIFAIKNRVAFGKMIEETTTDVITKLMGGLDNSLNQGNMFGGSDVQGSAAQGKVLGDDGKVGTRGSGQYASAVAGGHDPDAETKGVKDALGETLAQEEARERAAEASGEEFIPKTKQEIAKEAVNRAKGYKVAGAKDAVASSMGGLATAATMMGVADLDGRARERIADKEQHEREVISDDARGIGYGGDSKNGDGITRHDDNEHANEDGKHNAERKATEAKTAGEIAKDVEGMDTEELLVAGKGVISADDEQFGDISTASEVDADSDTYVPSDYEASDALEKAFGEDGSLINLDDPDDHPDHEPLSQEGIDYIDNLNTAAQEQKENADDHMEAATKEDAAKDAKRAEAERIRSNPDATDEDLQKADGLLAEADEHQRKAEEHKKKARSSIRKAQKLDAKQETARAKQADAIKNPSEHQSKAANAAREFTQAEDKLRSLTKDRVALDNEITALSESGENPERLGQLNDKLGQVNSEIKAKRKEIPELRDAAVKALPVDNSYDEDSMSPQEKASYTQARTEAARVVGKMAMQTGENVEETKAKQRGYAEQASEQRYGSKISSAKQAVESAVEAEQKAEREYQSAQQDPSVGQHQLNKLQQKYQMAQEQTDTAGRELKSLRSQESAFKRSVQLARSVNESHFDGQGKLRKSAVQTQNRTKKAVAERTKAIGKYNKSGALQPGNGRDIHNTQALKMKKQRLNELGVNSPNPETARQQYDNAVQSVESEYAKTNNLVNDLKNQSKVAKQSNNMAKVRTIGKRLEKAEASQEEAKRVRDMRLHQLRSNASGLFADNDGTGRYPVKNKAIRDRFINGSGGSIVGDVDKVVNVASELELLQIAYAKLDKSNDLSDLSKLSPKTRRIAQGLNTAMESKRKLLGRSQINSGLLKDPKTTRSFVDALRTEWSNVKDGNPDT